MKHLEVKKKCKLRGIDEILNMEDLYFRYNWAIDEKKINSSVSIGNLDIDNVIERRRGLTWALSDVDDWYDLSLNT